MLPSIVHHKCIVNRIFINRKYVFNFFCFTEASSEGVPTLAKNERAVVLISAWQSSGCTSSTECATESGETVTFESFLTNFNSGGGNGALDLDSGVFTCIIPGFYTVSYSAISYLKVSIDIGLTHIGINRMQLFKNNEDLVESVWGFATYGKPLDSQMAMTGTRTLVLE